MSCGYKEGRQLLEHLVKGSFATGAKPDKYGYL